jgi:transcriptional regulator with XRE-family HTH domain
MNTSELPSNRVTEPMDIGQLRLAFRKLRIARGLSQEYVARELLGVTQASLSAWETQKNQSMRTETLNRIFRLVGEWSKHEADGSNIVALVTSRQPSPPIESFIPRDTSRQADGREALLNAIKPRLNPGDASFQLVDTLPFEALLDIYILSKFGQQS